MDAKERRAHNNKVIGLRIKEILARKNMTQTDLAILTGINKNTINRYANGERALDIYNAIFIADALQVSLDELLCRW